MADGYSRPLEGKVTVLKMPPKPSKMSLAYRFTLGLAIMLGCSYVARTCGFLVLTIATLSYVRGQLGW